MNDGAERPRRGTDRDDQKTYEGSKRFEYLPVHVDALPDPPCSGCSVAYPVTMQYLGSLTRTGNIVIPVPQQRTH